MDHRWIRCLFALTLSMATLMGCATNPGAPWTSSRNLLSASAGETSLEHETHSHTQGKVTPLSPTIIVQPPAQTESPSIDTHSFAPVIHQSEVASWLPEGEPSADLLSLSVELRNACGLEFDYAFGPHEGPSEHQYEQRKLDAHTAQTQDIERGDWLHLWHQGRWLASVVSLGEDTNMEVAGSCDRLLVEHTNEEGQTREFALHWDLDAELGLPTPLQTPSERPSENAELGLDPEPEVWGSSEQPVLIYLLNFCPEPVDYSLSPALGDAIERSSTLEGNSARALEVPSDWWMRYRVVDDSWRGGVQCNTTGGRVWIAADCADFGVQHGSLDDAL